jgi:carbon-monoxide dehydrogenase medium subunit
MYDFSYSKPSTLADAANALTADMEAKALAGGMTFIPVLKQRLNKPSAVIDLHGLGLAYIKLEGNNLIIGAMTTHGAVNASPDVAGQIGDRQVRYRGTIGGSLANNDPAACYPSAVLALNATIKTDKRIIAADDFFQGMFTTALEPGELVTEIHFPIPERACYMKFPNPASRYPMVGVFVAKFPSGVRVAVTGAGQNGVFRHTAFETALSQNYSPDALTGLTTDPETLNGDIHASAPYRAHLITVMAKRAVAAS